VDHPLRSVLTEEVHARPFAALKPPQQASHLAFVSGEDAVVADFAHLVRLCEHYGVALPAPGARHFTFETLLLIILRQVVSCNVFWRLKPIA
jgi:uncharacterized membrane-anchored protein